MHGGITEQGAWRTMFGVASSVGLSRAFQNSLQEQGIDPMFDASKAEQYLQAERLKEQRATDIFKTIKAKPGESGVFGVNPLTGKPTSAGNSTPVDQESGVSMRLQPGAVQ